ncbi:MAG TPA: hypothetical protein VIK91_15815 [Nannocystis sp.]
MTRVHDELLADGEALLARREAVEQRIVREFRGTRPALQVQIAQVERLREQVRARLQQIVTAFDEAEAPADDDEDRDERLGAAESFYAERERLAARERELAAGIGALQRRAAEVRAEKLPPGLAELEREREQIEAQLRQWRARCRRAGFAPSLPRWGEYAGAEDD